MAAQESARQQFAPKWLSPGPMWMATLASAVLLVSGTIVPAGERSSQKDKPAAKPATRAVTFNRDVAPLVFQHCVAYHRTGQVAPFALVTYRDVSKRAEQILDVIERRSMPPWKPLDGHEAFANGRRLTSEEMALVRRWVAEGTPEGNAADLPAEPEFATGWQLGEPDLVITLSEPVSVPSTGRDIYLNLVLPLEIPQGKYLKAAEFHPSNRRVLHHAVLYCDKTGRARERDKEDSEQGFKAVTPPGRLLPGPLAIWTPGRNPLPLTEGLSMPWPAGADLVLQLHLHPSGKPEVEQSSVGFYFTDQPPQRSLIDVTLIDMKIDIPPGEKGYRTQDSCVLPIDMEAVWIFPHMHMIGKEIKITATLPDGSVRTLLCIDDWDFNWQDIYEFAEPVRLPKGTRLALAGVHDNSADNPLNPKNPPERVRWGEQTFNEMSLAFVNLMPVKESDLSEGYAHKDRHFGAAIVPASTQALLDKIPPAKKAAKDVDFVKRAQEAMPRVDQDGNGKLSLDEIMAVLGGRQLSAEIEKRFVQFDRDGDKQLNLSEVAEVLRALSK